VFKRLDIANITLNINKCEFFKEKINYLGHVVSVEGIQPSQDKIKAILNSNYDQIIDHFIIEIQVRFKKSNLEPVLDLFTLIMIDDERFEVIYDKLVIYSNLNELNYEFKVFFFIVPPQSTQI
jgi:hypothetical protein